MAEKNLGPKKVLVGELQKCRRVVIKVGTRLLSDSKAKDGINFAMIEKLAEEVSFLRKEGIEVMLVSSGAVYVGARSLAHHKLLEKGKIALRERQALSAIGQNLLMSAYQKTMAKVNIPVAQLLLSARDFQNRQSYLNMRHTIAELLRLRALPIINENDTVATEELQFGENDMLSAASAAAFHADYLLILSSVEGFLMKGKRLDYIEKIQSKHWEAAQGPEDFGQGGMRSKLRAAHLSTLSGIVCAMLPGTLPHPVRSFFQGEDIGSFFAAKKGRKLKARKRWLLLSPVRGAVVINKGAREALEKQGSSLLAVGLCNTRGYFLDHEVVEIEDEEGRALGRGLINYSHKEILEILAAGVKKEQKNNGGPNEIIHRDNLVLEL